MQRAVDLVENGLVQRAQRFLRMVGRLRARLDHTGEIDHVGIAFPAVVAAEIVGRRDRAGHLGIGPVLLCHAVEIAGIAVESGTQRDALSEVDQRERRLSLVAAVDAVPVIQVADHPA